MRITTAALIFAILAGPALAQSSPAPSGAAPAGMAEAQALRAKRQASGTTEPAAAPQKEPEPSTPIALTYGDLSALLALQTAQVQAQMAQQNAQVAVKKVQDQLTGSK